MHPLRHNPITVYHSVTGKKVRRIEIERVMRKFSNRCATIVALEARPNLLALQQAVMVRWQGASYQDFLVVDMC